MDDKVIYQGTTVVGETTSNPPPYTVDPPPPGQYGPPGPYNPPITQGPTIVTVGTSMVPVIMAQQMGPQPTRMTCKSCQCEIITRVESKPTLRTHMCAALLCLFICWPCVCIPYCMDSCMNMDHYCPNCKSYIGTYLS